LKIGSFTACSNVTGILTPYRELARIMHEHGGFCFVDFAACAPYLRIDMHPSNEAEKLDAVFFSPHKFLGGPGSSGVLIFDSEMYNLNAPDQPGGGTVLWTNPWGEYRYASDIEVREDGGTPGFLQAIKAALAVELKEQMGYDKLANREKEIVARMFRELRTIPGLRILAENIEDRLGIISFYFEKIHYNLVIQLLNDRFGIQTRGGCSCAGTYGHYLLQVDRLQSKEITDRIDKGDLSTKPGWVRLSLHPITTDEEVEFIADSLREIAKHADDWGKDYIYDSRTNEFRHRDGDCVKSTVEKWFEMGSDSKTSRDA